MIQYIIRKASSLSPAELATLDTLRLHLDEPSDLTRFLNDIPPDEKCRVVLALEEDTIVGWAVVEAWKSRPTSKKIHGIWGVFVAPGHRNRGIGTQLARRVYDLTDEVAPYPEYYEVGEPGGAFYHKVLGDYDPMRVFLHHAL